MTRTGGEGSVGEGMRGVPGYPREGPGGQLAAVLADLYQQGAFQDVQRFVFAGVQVQRGPGLPGAASLPSNTASSPAVSRESALTLAPTCYGRISPGASTYGPAR